MAGDMLGRPPDSCVDRDSEAKPLWNFICPRLSSFKATLYLSQSLLLLEVTTIRMSLMKLNVTDRARLNASLSASFRSIVRKTTSPTSMELLVDGTISVLKLRPDVSSYLWSRGLEALVRWYR